MEEMGTRKIWRNTDTLGKMDHLWGDEGPRSQAEHQAEQSHSNTTVRAAVSVTNGSFSVC